MWKTQTVVAVMTVNRALAISVLWVQLKAVYSTSWCRLVLIRERNQKLIILIYTLMIDKLKKYYSWLPCAFSLQAGKIKYYLNYLDFFTSNVLFL